MQNLTRREFLKTAAAGTLLTTSRLLQAQDVNIMGPVPLGKSGIQITRFAMGSGTSGYSQSSEQTRAGMAQFQKMTAHAWESGIRLFETADLYGSHTFFREALKEHDREEYVLETKIWNRNSDWNQYKGVNEAIDRFRHELDTDYLDIVLLHCMTNGNWQKEFAQDMEDLTALKEQKIIKAVGVSCHNLDALKVAAESEWIDVIQARINAYGPNMDASPEEVMPVLQKAHDAGKGVIGMKIYGCGKCIAPEQRQKSLEYVWTSGNVDAITIGYTETAHIDDTLSRSRQVFANMR